MRRSQTTADEIQATEESDRITSRKGGFSLIEIRDRGWGRLRELGGRDVVMIWGVKDELAAANKFKLVIDRKEYILDAEEFRRFLRWA